MIKVEEEFQEILKSVYVSLVRQFGHKTAGEIFGRIAYPALIEIGWMPPKEQTNG